MNLNRSSALPMSLFPSLDVNLNQTMRERTSSLPLSSFSSSSFLRSFYPYQLILPSSRLVSHGSSHYLRPSSFISPSHSLLPNSFNGRIARPVSSLLADMFHLIKPPTTFLVYSILNHPKASGRMGVGDPPPLSH